MITITAVPSAKALLGDALSYIARYRAGLELFLTHGRIELDAMLDRELQRLLGKSKLAEAIRYTLSRRAALERFLADGGIEIDSNIVERAIRPQNSTRTNALFAGSDGVGGGLGDNRHAAHHSQN
ncbi:transposase [Devosia sp. PTR5]|uniref:Transposase n=1 Tax=Devosia oryzisoli TaxID=2774138 RepID=A0A927FVC9_9HYPH|nr:transposase [Devosia oryzisoli]